MRHRTSTKFYTIRNSKFDSRQSRLTFNLPVGYLPILEDVRGLDGLIFPGVVVGVGVAVPLRGVGTRQNYSKLRKLGILGNFHFDNNTLTQGVQSNFSNLPP